jgi:hypothetical protein
MRWRRSTAGGSRHDQPSEVPSPHCAPSSPAFGLAARSFAVSELHRIRSATDVLDATTVLAARATVAGCCAVEELQARSIADARRESRAAVGGQARCARARPDVELLRPRADRRTARSIFTCIRGRAAGAARARGAAGARSTSRAGGAPSARRSSGSGASPGSRPGRPAAAGGAALACRPGATAFAARTGAAGGPSVGGTRAAAGRGAEHVAYEHQRRRLQAVSHWRRSLGALPGAAQYRRGREARHRIGL